MKLAIHNGSRVWGGNEKWLTTLALGLRSRGHDVVVSCRANAPLWRRLQEEGIETTPIRPGGELDLPSHVRFARWLRSIRPDSLLLTSWNRTPSAVAAARRAAVPRVVVRLGIVRPLPPRGRYARAFRTGVDAMIVNSSTIREEWLRSAPWYPAEDVHVVLNGIRPPSALPEGVREALRRELGVAGETILLAAAGHVTRRKGFDLLIRALARLSARNVHVVILGSGPEEPALRSLAGDLQVADRVHWTDFREEVAPVIGACDLFVLSSRNEGMANVMLEAMAIGTPVMATDISGVRDAIGAVRGRPPAGWIVPPEDPVALAETLEEALTTLADQDGTASQYAAEAKRRTESWFSVERMVEEAERVLF